MIKFKTMDAAIEYARENIGKYDDEIVLVDGKYTMLCSTCLPIEEKIRSHIETVVEDLLKHIQWNGKVKGREEDFTDDAINLCGAVATDAIIDELKRYGVNIMSAYLDF